VFAIIDSERDAVDAAVDRSRLKFQEACYALDIQCFVLERRALENYFTDKAVKAALGSSFEALGEYASLRDSENGWRKADNWRIASELSREDLVHTDLGRIVATIAESL
jgi:hypothetical protein